MRRRKDYPGGIRENDMQYGRSNSSSDNDMRHRDIDNSLTVDRMRNSKWDSIIHGCLADVDDMRSDFRERHASLFKKLADSMGWRTTVHRINSEKTTGWMRSGIKWRYGTRVRYDVPTV